MQDAATGQLGGFFWFEQIRRFWREQKVVGLSLPFRNHIIKSMLRAKKKKSKSKLSTLLAWRALLGREGLDSCSPSQSFSLHFVQQLLNTGWMGNLCSPEPHETPLLWPAARHPPAGLSRSHCFLTWQPASAGRMAPAGLVQLFQPCLLRNMHQDGSSVTWEPPKIYAQKQ